MALDQRLALRKRVAELVLPLENQYTFIEHYLRCKSAQHAVIRAGWAEEAGLEAIFIGKEFMLQDYVKDSLFAAQQMTVMHPSDILAALTEVAQASMEDFIAFDEDGNAQIDLQKAQALNRLGAIKKFKHTRQGMEFELYDRLSALKLLGQHAGLFINVVRHENWRDAAIRDIRAGTLTYQALLTAFDDEEVVKKLFEDAGVTKPQKTNLLSEGD